MSTLKYCSYHISSYKYRIFKILVSTPHNYPLIMWGKDKNFEDLMPPARDITCAIFQSGHFYCSTLYDTSAAVDRFDRYCGGCFSSRICFDQHCLLGSVSIDSVKVIVNINNNIISCILFALTLSTSKVIHSSNLLIHPSS
jgi:hypothetical protein